MGRKAEAAQRAHEAECTQGAAETYDAERQNNWTNSTMWGSQKWCRQDPQKHKPLCRIRRGVMCLKRLSDSAGSGEWAAEAEAAHRGHGAESTTGATETWDAESQGEWADPTAWAEPEMLEEGSPETQIPAAWADHQEGAAQQLSGLKPRCVRYLVNSITVPVTVILFTAGKAAAKGHKNAAESAASTLGQRSQHMHPVCNSFVSSEGHQMVHILEVIKGCIDRTVPCGDRRLIWAVVAETGVSSAGA